MFASCISNMASEEYVDQEIKNILGSNNKEAVLACCGFTVLEYSDIPGDTPFEFQPGRNGGPTRNERMEKQLRPPMLDLNAIDAFLEGQMPTGTSSLPRSPLSPAAPSVAPSIAATIGSAGSGGKEVVMISIAGDHPITVIGCCGMCKGNKPDHVGVVMDKSWWCSYCCCGGIGYAKQLGSMFMTCTCVCINCTCEPTEFGGSEGYCNFIQTSCCCTQLLQLPPRNGTPRCMICSSSFCGLHTHQVDPKKQEKSNDKHSTISPPMCFWDYVLFEQFTCCYLFCWGCIGHGTFMDCCKVTEKCFGWKCRTEFSSPYMQDEGCGADGCINGFCACGNVRSQIRLPPLAPRENNPVCACLGVRFKKKPTAKPLPSHVQKKTHSTHVVLD